MSVVPSDMQSPFVLTGLPKFQSMLNHRLMNDAVLAFIELKVVNAFPDETTQLTAADISKTMNYNAKRLYRLLNHVQYFGIVKAHQTSQSATPETDVKFSLTSDGALLRFDHPAKIASWFAWSGHPIMEYCQKKIPDVVSEPNDDYKISIVRYMHESDPEAEKELGDDFFTWMMTRRRQEIGVAFNDAMTGFSALEAPFVAQLYAPVLSQTHTLIDIGGNTGALAATIAHQHHNIKRAVVADLAPVIAAAKQSGQAERLGVAGRFNYAEVDFFQPGTLAKCFETHLADAVRENQSIVIILKHILHDWSDEKSLLILQNIRKALATVPEAECLVRLALAEMNIVPNEHPAASSVNWVTSAMDTHMFLTGGGQRNQAQWEKLFSESGWKLTNLVINAPSPISIVEAKAI